MNTAYGNHGDLLINKSLLDLLSERGNICLNTNNIPMAFLNGLQLNESKVSKTTSLFRDLPKEWMQNLFRSKADKINLSIVTIPGHFFGSELDKALKVFISGLVLHLFKLLGIKILKFGGCVGPFSKSVAMAEKFRAKAFDYYSVRDTISIKYFEKYGFTPEYFPDLAFLTSFQNLNSIPQPTKYFVLSFRHSTNAMMHNANYLDKLYQKLDSIVHDTAKLTDATVVISYQVLNDRATCIKLKDRYESKGLEVTFIDKLLELQEAYDLYASAEIVLSNRLHVLLLALQGDTLPAAIINKSEHHKITGIYSDENLQDLILDIHNSERVEEFTKNLFENKQTHLNNIQTIKNSTYNTGREKINDILPGN